jgi:hypothetical protein
MEVVMDDPFVGVWKLDPARSAFDPNHRPTEATMEFVRDGPGYVMTATGTSGKGERVAEKPQSLIPDGQRRPIPDFPGLSASTTQRGARSLHAEATREDGSLVGEGRYVVSDDGGTLTATTAGFDTQLRRFESQTIWVRVSGA